MDEERTGKSIGELLAGYTIQEKKTRTSKRAMMIEELWQLYKSHQYQENKENWRRYIQWLKVRRINEKVVSREKAIAQFKKEKLLSYRERYIKPWTDVKNLCIAYGHVNTEDLPFMISTAKDRSARGEDVAKYIRASVYPTKSFPQGDVAQSFTK